MSNNRNRRRRNGSKPTPNATLTPGVLQLDWPENQDKIKAMIADREPLFSIGDEVYTIPKKVPPAWTMQVADLAATNYNAALAMALGLMLGPEGYEALKNCRTLTTDDLTTVFQVVSNRVLPGVVGPKAPSTSGTNGSQS